MKGRVFGNLHPMTCPIPTHKSSLKRLALIPAPHPLDHARAMALCLPNSFLHKNLSPSVSLGTKVKGDAGSNQMRWSCRKKDIHPEFYEDAKVYCNGELVMTTGGTKKEYVVDVWSGNHPFYLGSRSQLVVEADQVEKFRKRFSGLDQIMEIPVLKGEIVLPPKKKSGKGKKK